MVSLTEASSVRMIFDLLSPRRNFETLSDRSSLFLILGLTLPGVSIIVKKR